MPNRCELPAAELSSVRLVPDWRSPAAPALPCEPVQGCEIRRDLVWLTLRMRTRASQLTSACCWALALARARSACSLAEACIKVAL